MTFFRRRLRLLAAAWFLFQGASLSAIVPRDCCATHRQASQLREHDQHHSVQQDPVQQDAVQEDSQASCHKPVTVTPDETQCPMRGATGAACPMHRKGHGAHATHADMPSPSDTPSTETGAPTCSMRAICDAPMAALAALLVQPGVLPNRAAFPVDLHVDSAPPDAPARPIHGLVSPDLPPPRA